jgi:hypothetical protein
MEQPTWTLPTYGFSDSEYGSFEVLGSVDGRISEVRFLHCHLSGKSCGSCLAFSCAPLVGVWYLLMYLTIRQGRCIKASSGNWNDQENQIKVVEVNVILCKIRYIMVRYGNFCWHFQCIPITKYLSFNMRRQWLRSRWSSGWLDPDPYIRIFYAWYVECWSLYKEIVIDDVIVYLFHVSQATSVVRDVMMTSSLIQSF